MAIIRYAENGLKVERELTSETVTIGRHHTSDVCLRESNISNHHAEFRCRDGKWFIVDRESSNHTYVNEEQIEPLVEVPISNGDTLTLAKKTLVFFDEPNSSNTGVLLSRADYLKSEELEFVPELRNDESDLRDSGHTILREFPTVRQGVEFIEGTRADSLVQLPDETLAQSQVRITQAVSQRLVGKLSLGEMLEQIMDIAMSQAKADRGVLYGLDNRQPYPMLQRGFDTRECVLDNRDLLMKAINTRDSILAHQEEHKRKTGISSVLYVPLCLGSDVFGLLSLQSMSPHRRFSATDLELIKVVAFQAAIGIERTRIEKEAAQGQGRIDYLSKYLDARLVQQILNASADGTDPLAPKEREVTILFADIVSFTKLCEKLQPTEIAALLQDYFSLTTEVIFQNDGTVDKFIGDEVMALFGAPLPTENDVVSSIRCALEIVRRMTEIKVPIADQAVVASVGVKTGRVVVGNLGSENRHEYTAVGDAVNVAARLQAFARPNEICVDDDTLAKTNGLFDVERIGHIDVKGRAAPVDVFRVLGEK